MQNYVCGYAHFLFHQFTNWADDIDINIDNDIDNDIDNEFRKKYIFAANETILYNVLTEILSTQS